MALKVKAKEKLLKFSKEDEGFYRWVMLPELYSALTQEKVIREAALHPVVAASVAKPTPSMVERQGLTPCRSSLCVAWH